MVSSCINALCLPTAALPTSGLRVEGHTFLSACHYKLPCIFNCRSAAGFPASAPGMDYMPDSGITQDEFTEKTCGMGSCFFSYFISIGLDSKKHADFYLHFTI